MSIVVTMPCNLFCILACRLLCVLCVFLSIGVGDRGGGDRGARASLKFGKIFFGQLLCKIREVC